VLGNGAAEADFKIIRMRAKDEQVDAIGHRPILPIESLIHRGQGRIVNFCAATRSGARGFPHPHGAAVHVGRRVHTPFLERSLDCHHIVR
jgi:hypothetical protein